MNMDFKKYMTLPETAGYLGVGVDMVKKWWSDGLFGESRIWCGREAVKKTDLERFAGVNAGLLAVARRIKAEQDALLKLEKDVHEQISVSQRELDDRRWVNCHIEYFSETFSLFIELLAGAEDESDNARLVRLFLEGNSYRDIAAVTGMSLLQVMSVIRTFGRRTIRARHAAFLLQQEGGAGVPSDTDIIVDGAGFTLSTPVENLGLSRRLTNCLKSLGQDVRVANVLYLSDKQLISMRNMGKKSLHEWHDFKQRYIKNNPS